MLAAAIAVGRSGVDATDEAALAERAGHQVHVVDGDPGNVKITTLNLKVVEADSEREILLVRGAVPGPNGGLVLVRDAVKGAK